MKKLKISRQNHQNNKLTTKYQNYSNQCKETCIITLTINNFPVWCTRLWQVCNMLSSLENYYWRYTSASELVNMILAFVETRAVQVGSVPLPSYGISETTAWAVMVRYWKVETNYHFCRLIAALLLLLMHCGLRFKVRSYHPQNCDFTLRSVYFFMFRSRQRSRKFREICFCLFSRLIF